MCWLSKRSHHGLVPCLLDGLFLGYSSTLQIHLSTVPAAQSNTRWIRCCLTHTFASKLCDKRYCRPLQADSFLPIFWGRASVWIRNPLQHLQTRHHGCPGEPKVCPFDVFSSSLLQLWLEPQARTMQAAATPCLQGFAWTSC